MDTNQVAQLVAEFAKQAKPGVDGPTVLTAIGLISALIMSALTLILSHFANTRSKGTAAEVGKIHVAVNSKTEAMESLVEELRTQVNVLTAEKAVSAERERGQQLKDAAAVVVVAPAPQFVSEARLLEILAERDKGKDSVARQRD